MVRSVEAERRVGALKSLPRMQARGSVGASALALPDDARRHCMGGDLRSGSRRGDELPHELVQLRAVA